jgi:hypothetical protein
MFHNLDVKKELFQIQVEARHFTQSGEMLIESHNKFFIKEVIWEIESKDHD